MKNLLVLALCLFATPVLAQDTRPAPARSLAPELDLLLEDRVFKEAEAGLQVVNLRTGEEVFGQNQDADLVPASTMKVVTAAAALTTLGPAYRFTTSVLGDGELKADGTLEGNLVVVGGGDPTLVIEKVWKLAVDLKLNGLTTVTGDLVLDDSFFDGDHVIAGWDKTADVEEGPSYFPSIGALSVNFNTAAVVVTPGPEEGAPARVLLETPAGKLVQVESTVTTTAKGKGRRVELERRVDGPRVVLAAAGTVALGTEPVRYYRAVPDPTAYFGAVFSEVLKAQGIVVKGTVREGTAGPKATRLLTLRSSSLGAILMDMNKYSNNFMAEQVFRALGAAASGGPGSTAAGVEAVMAYLDGVGLDRSTYTVVNGSGLSRDARFKPSHLNAVLVAMAADPVAGPEFLSSLAIGGRDGTLWSRFKAEDEVDRVRGKTGTLGGVHCLVGYVRAGDGEVYAFSYLVNDLPSSMRDARQAHDRLCGILCDLEPASASADTGGAGVATP